MPDESTILYEHPRASIADMDEDDADTSDTDDTDADDTDADSDSEDPS